MAAQPEITLHIDQRSNGGGSHTIELRLKQPGVPEQTARAEIEFTLSEQEHAELRWYLEDYLLRSETVTAEHVRQSEDSIQSRGEELYRKVLRANDGTQDLWSSVRNRLADLRVEIATSIADAAAIPWELMYEPKSDSAIALRAKSFVRVQSNPNISFVTPAEPDELGRVRLLYVVCRPNGRNDVELRAVVNQLLQGLGDDLDRFEITALRPPTYERLQDVLRDAKAAGRPYHIVHFDGHGMYADLEQTALAEWAAVLSSVMLDSAKLKADTNGKYGYLLFEHPVSDEKMRPVRGEQLGKLLHDCGVPVLVLNACQSAMHEAIQPAGDSLDEARAIGSLAQAVVDQGIPAVLGMRYSVFVVTAAQYIGQLYSALAKGRDFGQAATEGRRHLHDNPERWVGLEPRPLQDWCVPVAFEADPLRLFPDVTAKRMENLREQSREAVTRLDPVENGAIPVRYVPDTGFVGRDETLLELDRAFDSHRIVLLYAYAGQGKTTTAVEFARWYATTGGLGSQPNVLLTSFESTKTLNDVLDTVGQQTVEDWAAINKPEEKQAKVRDVLRSVPLLWIWDNVEPVAGFPTGTPSQWTEGEQQELADFLKLIKLDRQSKAKVLLTSRRDERAWLGEIPERVKMPRMRNSDVARLACELGATKHRPASEISDWLPLLDYCAGNPLTLHVLVKQAVDMGLRGKDQIAAFVRAVRDGEQQIKDVDADQGRDVSLGAALAYGFRFAFSESDLPIVALLHLFQGVVNADTLKLMSLKENEYSLPELAGRSEGSLTDLLDRCSEIGLLTPIAGRLYGVHPAVPWFLDELFRKFYPSAPQSAQSCGPSTAASARRAWVEAVAALGDYFLGQFNEGNRRVVNLLSLEEPNLLRARCVSRRHDWWMATIGTMQGVRVLYGHFGRIAEWSRLVAEVVRDFCTDTDDPIRGREDGYRLVVGYRVELAKDHERDLPEAARLQQKLVDLSRAQCAVELAMPQDFPFEREQLNRLRSLAVSVGTLGQILMEQRNGDYISAIEESVRHLQRIGDTATEAIGHYNLGHAYIRPGAMQDLDAAEAAYWRSYRLLSEEDALGRARCIKQIGAVNHQRFIELRATIRQQMSRSDGTTDFEGPESIKIAEESVLRAAQATEQFLCQALSLYPASAIIDRGYNHQELGSFFCDVGKLERGQEHFEKAVHCFEKSGKRFDAGQTRFNLSLMYRHSASSESTSRGKERLLRRAKAYAEAAQEDFRHYEGRADGDATEVVRLIADIDQQLQSRGD